MHAGEPIIVVSGLPRSGTSLMMQMLSAGGVPVLTDDLRPADVSNPRGYFEYEPVKWLARDNSCIAAGRGRAVKVIAQLVPFLPAGERYQFVFMHRDLGEVLRSQTSMIAARGGQPAGPTEALAAIFERQLAAAEAHAQRLPHSTILVVEHRRLISDAVSVINGIADFLGRPDLDRVAMSKIVDPVLYRAR